MATLASSSSSSSPRCVPFAFRRGGGERRARGLPAPAAGSHALGPGPAAGCGRPLCRAAEVVGGGIRGAFFASLDRCSCVEVRTKHDDDSFRMADAAPLMRDGSSYGAASGRTASGGKGNKQRQGLGCCAANSSSVN
ncbi:hypothetical protein PAHAL_3G510400 [Panicum hallii]|uniref:Uncharacterized protein n=1 Tax=Panicum hallii TaxID=206008 RepID=A0A2S3HFT8_9POAL|nr:uncharacterized protein LOC112884338 [Panicum hallii]PAN22067.1 hypothetical protein PAHAL_3G510400 [Panicum hallii]